MPIYKFSILKIKCLGYYKILNNFKGKSIRVMSKWIFVQSGKREDFDERIETGKWPIFKLTHHRNRLKKGDIVLFYLGGKPNKKILGTGVLGSRLKPEPGDEFSVELADVEIWDEPLSMKEMVESMDFIKNKKNWGIYFQGGITPLPQKDYERILNFRK
jgi:hypothetical protein